jgi:nucleoside-diphosphate-sugar epimerase
LNGIKSNKKNKTIMVTGCSGYIGMVMTRFLQQHSYKVRGLDTDFYENCYLYSPESRPSDMIKKDIRDVGEEDLDGVSAIIHLAALSNDPVGALNPELTHEINCVASEKLARLAKKRGIGKFIFSSSCSLYGISTDDRPLTEEGRLNPITAYAKAKVDTEKALAVLASDTFHPVFMRNSTVYGLSPCLRLDLVVNNLVAWAYTTGRVVVMSDGTPWRPIIHVEDLCRAFLTVLEAPVAKIHNQAFNVGIDEENYQVKDIARKIEILVPHSTVEILNKSESDERSYRVDFSKVKKVLPGFKPVWNLSLGIKEIYKAYREFGLKKEDLKSEKFFRVRWIKHLMEQKKLNDSLRWTR